LNCATCHQDTGLGVAGVYPPLAKSEFVNGSPKRLGMILLKGIQGPITVEGHQFGAAVMPAWDKLNDQKIGAVLTYVRQAWGNTSGEITPEQIAAARKEFADHAESWTEADILKIPPDATLPGAAAPAPPAAATPAKK
jgi:mono/diheme cytochrome c family protein